MSETMNATTAAELGRIAVLYGGTSPERDVSLMSGQAVYEGLLAAGAEAVLIDIGTDPIVQLDAMSMDVAFVALHGVGGEDGTIQALLEAKQIPHTGSGVAASALAMDKYRTKQMWRGMGFPTADFKLLSQNTDWAQLLDKLGGKVVVKPVREGSSLGISIAETEQEAQVAFQTASEYDAIVIAETWLSGREFTIAILGDQALPVIETRTGQDFYDYEAKYISDATEYLVPAPVDQDLYNEMQTLAVDAFNSLGCRGWGRVDMMLAEDGSPKLLEVNTSPGMTSHSLVPMAAKAAGIDFPELVVRVTQMAMDANRL